jgi:hypothetical protein
MNEIRNDHVEDERIPGTEVMRDHDGIVMARAHGDGQVCVGGWEF